MLTGHATNANSIVLGLTRPWLEPTIYHTRCQHADHNTIDVVSLVLRIAMFGVHKRNILRYVLFTSTFAVYEKRKYNSLVS
jgi:hypothetical protein